MATAVTSVENLCNLLKRSRLIKEQQVKSIYQQWRAREPRGSANETERFVKWLVACRYATSYQAQQLIHGNADYFFLNHYKLLDLIGKGRMAGIFKAAHILGHIVAVKLMPASKSQDAQLLGRFRREAKMAVRLKHPNIVRTYHMGNAGGRFYIVMEHLEGETLEDTLKRRGRLPYAEGCRLLHQALMGLQHIHEQGMIHRDLKPANLMFIPLRPPGAPDNTLNATVKILDIGLGRILFDEALTSGQEQIMLTTDGMLLGTPEYMAPEQARDAHKADVRADVYSLGCVLYQVLSGQTPFTEKSTVQQLMRHAQYKPRPIRELERSVPDGLQAVLDTMLAKDPAQRFSRPEKAAQALMPFLGTQPYRPPEASSLTQSYLKWVEAQPIEEVNGAHAASERWYYTHAGKTVGPVAGSQLTQAAAAGKLDPNDFLWMEGDDPSYAIPAKGAISFATPARAPTTTPLPPAIAQMGFNPETGQILDAAKFKKWQQEQKVRRDQELAAQPSLQEIFLKARATLGHWVDLDRNRQLIMNGDLEAVRHDDDIRRFMHSHQRHGQEMLHKLWHYLEFMIENRRKYYYALM